MSPSSSQAGKWLVLLVVGTLLIDWALRTLAAVVVTVLPVVITVAVIGLVVAAVHRLARRGGGGW
jgi:hypothetical protein